MSKVILLSVVMVFSVLPLALSERRAPKRTLRVVQALCVVAVFMWTFACLRWYPELVPLADQ